MENPDLSSNSSEVVISSNQENSLEVSETGSCLLAGLCLKDFEFLTREDSNTRKCTHYDAFVCYADEDVSFVYTLARYLESEDVGFKLFIRERDLLGGHHSEYETSLKLIEERSRYVLVILSPDFLKCSAYEAQAGFAAVTGLNESYRKLIPILYKSCEVPRIYKFFSKIDFTRGTLEIEAGKIVDSMRGDHGSSWFAEEKEPPAYTNLQKPQNVSPAHLSGNIFIPTYAIDRNKNLDIIYCRNGTSGIFTQVAACFHNFK